MRSRVIGQRSKRKLPASSKTVLLSKTWPEERTTGDSISVIMMGSLKASGLSARGPERWADEPGLRLFGQFGVRATPWSIRLLHLHHQQLPHLVYDFTLLRILQQFDAQRGLPLDRDLGRALTLKYALRRGLELLHVEAVWCPQPLHVGETQAKLRSAARSSSVCSIERSERSRGGWGSKSSSSRVTAGVAAATQSSDIIGSIASEPESVHSAKSDGAKVPVT